MISGFAWTRDSAAIVYSSSSADTMPYLPTMQLREIRLRDGAIRELTFGDESYTYPDIGQGGGIVASRVRMQSDIWKFPIDGTPEENVRRAVRVTHQTSHVLIIFHPGYKPNLLFCPLIKLAIEIVGFIKNHKAVSR
jgi:hypothetical protein